MQRFRVLHFRFDLFPNLVSMPIAFRRHRWLVGVLYLVIIVLGVAPELAATVGLTGLQAAALAVVCLVVLAHGLAWELLTTTDDDRVPDDA